MIFQKLVAETEQQEPFLLNSDPHVSGDRDQRKECKEVRPREEEAKKHEEIAEIGQMPHVAIWTPSDKSMVFCHSPRNSISCPRDHAPDEEKISGSSENQPNNLRTGHHRRLKPQRQNEKHGLPACECKE